MLGLGQNAAFALAITYMALRSRDASQTSRLSSMAQTVGYVIAATGPLAMGALHDLTETWAVPPLVMLAMFVPQGILGLLAGRDRVVV